MKKKDYFVFFAMAMELVGLVLTLTYLGYWIEQSHPFYGLGPAIGAMLGLTFWIVHLLKTIKDIE